MVNGQAAKKNVCQKKPGLKRKHREQPREPRKLGKERESKKKKRLSGDFHLLPPVLTRLAEREEEKEGKSWPSKTERKEKKKQKFSSQNYHHFRLARIV